MKIVAVNGSPRKTWNTARLLEQVLAGAVTKGMEPQLIHLYDLSFKGCISCFTCKLRGGNSYGRCVHRDDLAPVLNAIHSADALVLGTPIYFSAETGEMRSFMERLQFQYAVYSEPFRSLFPGRIRTALVYTMNVPETHLADLGYDHLFARTQETLDRLIGPCEVLASTDTLQFPDYSRYETSRFDATAKQQHHRDVFPHDLQKAFELGRRLAEPIESE
jgi:multimeric flavodoxin WrbA